MGVVTSLFGLSFVKPGLWPSLAPALVFFVIHHGLSKGALFLGTGITGGRTRLPGVLFWPTTVLLILLNIQLI